MTRKRLLLWVWITIAAFTIAISTGVVLKLLYPDKDNPIYLTYKDLLPLTVAIPAAWLSYCFQRRTSYLQALRVLWNDLLEAANQAVEYTRWESTRGEEDFRSTIAALSKSIDAVRGVFKNVPRAGTSKGLYPYENLKDIRTIIGWLGYGEQCSKEKSDEAHKCIVRLWGEMHSALLQEFDTEIPVHPVGKYFDSRIDLATRLIQGNLTEEDLKTFDSQCSLPSK